MTGRMATSLLSAVEALTRRCQPLPTPQSCDRRSVMASTVATFGLTSPRSRRLLAIRGTLPPDAVEVSYRGSAACRSGYSRSQPCRDARRDRPGGGAWAPDGLVD